MHMHACPMHASYLVPHESLALHLPQLPSTTFFGVEHLTLFHREFFNPRCLIHIANSHSLTHSLTQSLTQSLTHSLVRSLNQSLVHSITRSLNHSPTHALNHSLTRSPNQSFTHTHAFIYSHISYLDQRLAPVAGLGSVRINNRPVAHIHKAYKNKRECVYA